MHQSTQQSTTRVGALMAHHPAWANHHTGGSQSIPKGHPCSRKGGDCGLLTNNTQVTQDEMSPHDTKGRTSPRHGSGAWLRHDRGSRPRHEHDRRYVCPDVICKDLHTFTEPRWLRNPAGSNARRPTTTSPCRNDGYAEDVVKDPLTRSQRARCAAYVSWMKRTGKARSMVMTLGKQQVRCGSCGECLEREHRQSCVSEQTAFRRL